MYNFFCFCSLLVKMIIVLDTMISRIFQCLHCPYPPPFIQYFIHTVLFFYSIIILYRTFADYFKQPAYIIDESQPLPEGPGSSAISASTRKRKCSSRKLEEEFCDLIAAYEEEKKNSESHHKNFVTFFSQYVKSQLLRISDDEERSKVIHKLQICLYKEMHGDPS